MLPFQITQFSRYFSQDREIASHDAATEHRAGGDGGDGGDGGNGESGRYHQGGSAAALSPGVMPC